MNSKILPYVVLRPGSKNRFSAYRIYFLGFSQRGKVFLLGVILTGVCMGCTVPPPGPITPTNTPPELSDFIFPSLYRDIFLNKNIYYFPGARVSYKDPEANLSQLILTFRQGITSSSLIGQVVTYSTTGTLALNGFVRNIGSPGLDVFSPGTVTVSIQAIDRAGARSNVLTTTFVLL